MQCTNCKLAVMKMVKVDGGYLYYLCKHCGYKVKEEEYNK